LATPQGVDLNMDKFNLSSAEKSGEWGKKVLAAEGEGPLKCSAFWSNLSSEESMLSQETKTLLTAVFDSQLCDRRGDGELFVPPPTNCADKLRHLILAEAATRKQRTDFFLSDVFSAETNVSDGSIFPASWAPSIGLDNKTAQTPEVLKLRPDLKSQAQVLSEFLVGAVPKFDRCTEDGTRWLVYRVGALEIRAIQAPGGSVEIGAVFSVLSSLDQGAQGRRTAADSEVITEVKLCVESAAHGKLRSQHFLAVTTQAGSKVLIERRGDGSLAWVEGARNVEDRISLAKTVESISDCKKGTTIGELRAQHEVEASANVDSASGSRSKRYANSLYMLASGRVGLRSCPDRETIIGSLMGPFA